MSAGEILRRARSFVSISFFFWVSLGRAMGRWAWAWTQDSGDGCLQAAFPLGHRRFGIFSVLVANWETTWVNY